MRRSVLVLISFMLLADLVRGQSRPQLSPEVREFVKIDAPVIMLNHVRVIDGTGVAPRTDQALVIQDGKIFAIGDASGGENTRSGQDARSLWLQRHPRIGRDAQPPTLHGGPISRTLRAS